MRNIIDFMHYLLFLLILNSCNSYKIKIINQKRYYHLNDTIKLKIKNNTKNDIGYLLSLDLYIDSLKTWSNVEPDVFEYSEYDPNHSQIKEIKSLRTDTLIIPVKKLIGYKYYPNEDLSITFINCSYNLKLKDKKTKSFIILDANSRLLH